MEAKAAYCSDEISMSISSREQIGKSESWKFYQVDDLYIHDIDKVAILHES